MPAPGDDGPRILGWLIASLSLVLPFIGAVLAFIGAGEMYRGGAHGWLLWVGAGCFLLLDLAIDFWWAHPSVSQSDQPDLNARGAQLAGRVAIVEVLIEDGRGKVRIGDTLWPAEGPDCPAGSEVQIIAAKGTTLVVASQDSTSQGST